MGEFQNRREWPTIIKVAREYNLTPQETLMLLAIRGAEQGAGYEKRKILDIKKNMVYTLSKKEVERWIQKYAPTVKEKKIYLLFGKIELDLKEKELDVKSAKLLDLKSGGTKIKILLVPEEKELIESIENAFLKKNDDIIKNTGIDIEQGQNNGENLIPTKLMQVRKNDIPRKEGFSLFGLNGKEGLNAKNVDMIEISHASNGIIETLIKKNFGLKLRALHPITIGELPQKFQNVDYFVLLVISKNIIQTLTETNLSGMEYYQLDLLSDSKGVELNFYKDLGYEFGVKAAKGTNLETQAKWAAGSIKNNRRRYNEFLTTGFYMENGKPVQPGGKTWKLGADMPDFAEFTAYLGGPQGMGYAPIYAPTMPKEERELNLNWAKNVRNLIGKYDKSFKDRGVRE